MNDITKNEYLQRKQQESGIDRPELPWDDSTGHHIRILDNVFGYDICDRCMDIFDELEDQGLTHNRREHGATHLQRADTSIFYTEMDPMINSGMQEIGEYIKTDIIPSWNIKYPLLDGGLYQGMYNAAMKMQKTRPSEGYHNWHCEAGSGVYDRTSVLAWMIYLNDVEEGGETEFLYQGIRMSPVKGRFICWPAGWTHVHRGNPPLKETKYAITGWINYIV